MIESQHSNLNQTELLSNNLNQFIKTFVSADTPKRESLFKGFCEYLLNSGNGVGKEVLQELSQGNILLLEKAMKNEWETTSSGNRLWTDTGTIVGLSEDGNIWGYFSKPPPKEILTNEYGNESFNFYRIALMKALVSFHLDKGGKKGDAGQYAEYLNSIGYPKHAGFIENPALINGQKVYFGSSGCEVNQTLLKGVPDPDGEKHFRLAGYFDEMFAKRIARKLSGVAPAKKLGSLKIPQRILRNKFYN